MRPFFRQLVLGGPNASLSLLKGVVMGEYLLVKGSSPRVISKLITTGLSALHAEEPKSFRRLLISKRQLIFEEGDPRSDSSKRRFSVRL